MKINRINFARSFSLNGRTVTNFIPAETLWKGWNAEVRGASVYLVPPPRVEGRRIAVEVPRVSCEVFYELAADEAFEWQLSKAPEPAKVPEAAAQTKGEQKGGAK